MFDRIFSSFKKEVDDIHKQPGQYRISGLWDNTLGLNFNKEDLMSFGSSEISIGLSLVSNEVDKTKMERDLANWEVLTYGLPIKVLEYPQKYGLRGSTIEERIFTIPMAFRASYNAHRINQLCCGDLAEIGGGFGSVPYHLFKDFNYKGRYFNFDLPHPNLMAKYFLMDTFPKKRFLLYGEDDIKNYKKYDIILMPWYEIRKLPDSCCELVFNSHSMAEMGTEQIQEYLRQIDRLTKQFLHLNHDAQTYNTKGEHFGVDKKKLFNFSEMKIPGWRMIYRFPEILSGENNFLYYEYLWQKYQ